MSLNNDNSIELSDDLEDGDDDFYYEVEKILQMHVTENGTRMFEIKWKNYDSEYSNTWEPEHNLNCPSILKAFLEKNGYAQKPEKKKKKKKAIKPKIDEVEFFKDSDVEVSPSSSTSNNKQNDELKTKKRKTSKEPENQTSLEKKTELKRKKQATEDSIKDVTRDLDEARSLQQKDSKKKVDETTKGSSNDKSTTKSTIPKQNSNDESFTALKRGTKSKTPSLGIKDILRLMQTPNRPPPTPAYTQSKFRIQTNPPNHYEINNRYNSPTNTTTSPSLHASKPSQPSPSSPKIPAFPPPSTPSPSPPHIPQHTVNNNPPVIPNAIDWQLTDIRARQRLQSNNLNPNYPSSNPRPPPPPMKYDQNGLKRPLSNPKDPRMKPDNMKRLKYSNATAIPTPFRMDVIIYNGSKFIATVELEGKQTCYHEVKIKALLAAISTNSKELRIANTIPLKSLNVVLKDRPISFMGISPKDHIVDVSKLKSYYQVNEMAGVLHHPTYPQAMIILAEADLKKLSNIDRDSLDITPYTSLVVLFIEELIPRPKLLDTVIQYELDSNDISTPFAWQRVTKYLKFPEQLTRLSTKAKFLIYGHSDTSSMLSKANSSLKPPQQPSYVMMFDRYNETVFSRNLTKHKKEPSTQIWVFGVPNFSEGKMIPAIEVFPNNSGGFVTTNMENILHNPKIINDIIAQVAKFNAIPAMYGEWKFILPYNWVQQMKKLIKDTDTAERAREAIISITIALSSDSIFILKLWCTETEEPSIVKYLDRVAHEKYTTHQYFVCIDEIDSIPNDERIHSIDFVESSKLFSTFG